MLGQRLLLSADSHLDQLLQRLLPALVMKNERIVSIPKGIVEERIKARHEAIEGKEYTDETLPAIVEPESENIEEPMIEPEISPPSYYDTSEIGEAKEPIEIYKPIETVEPQKISDPTPTQVHEIESEQAQEEIIKESSTARRKCPECGNTNKMLIREVTDNSRIISPMAGLYGKKFICGQCGAEWR